MEENVKRLRIAVKNASSQKKVLMAKLLNY